MIRPISIRPVLNGFVCQVGCQEVVFSSRHDLLEALNLYLVNPQEVEMQFVASACNARFFPAAGGDAAPGNLVGATADRLHQASEELRARTGYPMPNRNTGESSTAPVPTQSRY